MGCTQSVEVDLEAKRRNDEIDKQLKEDREYMRREVKMLLLGAGESGKSTVLKQMRLIYNKPYDTEERDSYREIVFSNTVQSMKILLDGMDILDIDMSNPANIKFSEIVKSAPSLVEGISNGGAKRFPPILAAAVRALWQDDGVRIAFANRSHLQLNDSAQYFFDSINRLSSVEYMPSDQDILRARVKTTGITETHFEIGDMNYKLFDVGGQRSERRKWLGIFENVTALIFLIAISEYDQNLYEDETVNRMHEAMTLFESVVNSRWFVQTSIILFLNKTDLFAQKLSTSPLRETFAEYTGGDNYHLACEFLLSKYNALNHHPEKKMIYPHLTNATDTRALSFVVSAVTDVIMQSNLKSMGVF